MTKEEREEFEVLARPIIKWLNDHTNPHSKVIIDTISAQLLSGEIGIYTEEFVRD